MPSVVSSFASKLGDRGVRVVETDPDDVSMTLESEIEPPAVGTALEDLPVDMETLAVEVTLDPTPTELDESTTGITGTAFGIADYGSVVVRGGRAGQEPVSLYPDRHVAVVRGADIVPDMRTAMERIADSIANGHRSHVIATGPSATADMGSLVEGAHGPKAVTVVVVTDT